MCKPFVCLYVQIQSEALIFDWSPGEQQGFFRPDHIPDAVFTSTKVPQPDGSWVWGPHKDAKLPFSAAGVITFTIMSLQFIKTFTPPALEVWPVWLKAWVLHARAVCAILRFHFTFADLLKLERLIIEGERLIQTYPPYADLWIPKAHWILHVAHDIYRFGPSRLLWTFLKEMKLAAFKRGVKRGNFHNPVKCAATFWCEQSDYQLQHASFSRDACSDPAVLVSGLVRDLVTGSKPLTVMVEAGVLVPESHVDMLSSVAFHGVPIRKGACVLVKRALYSVLRIVATRTHRCDTYYLWLRLLCAELHADQWGAWVAHIDTSCESYRLLSLNNGSDVTCVYCVPNGECMSVIVKM